MGVESRPVRTPDDLDQVAGLIIPGGESTTIGKMAVRFGLLEPLKAHISAGMPVFGTCAGMIFLAAAVTSGEQPLLGALDATIERNAFGRQNESFEADLNIQGWSEPFHAVFIRAPWVRTVGDQVEVMATIDGHPVMVRQGHILASSFHPELTGDDRIHRLFVDSI